MLPKRLRLNVGGVFGRRPRVAHAPLLTVKRFPAASVHARCGVVVTKKIAAGAAERNAVRRKIYRALARILPLMPVADYVIIAQPGAARAEERALYESLVSVIIR
jgi:ribonuclease P protein component